MNEQLRLLPFERFGCELDSALKYLGRLGLKIIINRVPQHLDRMRHGKLGIVKFDLHVDDVGYADRATAAMFSAVQIPPPTAIRPVTHVMSILKAPC